VQLGVVMRDRVEHRLRLLRRRRVVEIDERLAADGALENREVGPDARDVEDGRRDERHRLSTSARSRASCANSSVSSAWRSGSIWTRSRIWPANAWMSMSRASANVSPRAQIEDRVFVELSDRRPVRALHVVGKNLELRLRVDRRVVGK